jgi:hypothetical protein
MVHVLIFLLARPNDASQCRILNAPGRHCHVANGDTEGYFACMWLKSHSFSGWCTMPRQFS